MKKFLAVVIMLAVIAVGGYYAKVFIDQKAEEKKHDEEIKAQMTELISGTINAKQVEARSAGEFDGKTGQYMDYIVYDREKKIVLDANIYDLRGVDDKYYYYYTYDGDEWFQVDISTQEWAMALAEAKGKLSGSGLYSELLIGQFVKGVEKVKDTTINGQSVSKYKIEFVDNITENDWSLYESIFEEELSDAEIEEYQELYNLILEEYEKWKETKTTRKYIWVNKKGQIVKMKTDYSLGYYLHVLSTLCSEEENLEYTKKDAKKDAKKIVKEQPTYYEVIRIKYNDKCRTLTLPEEYTEAAY